MRGNTIKIYSNLFCDGITLNNITEYKKVERLFYCRETLVNYFQRNLFNITWSLNHKAQTLF